MTPSSRTQACVMSKSMTQQCLLSRVPAWSASRRRKPSDSFSSWKAAQSMEGLMDKLNLDLSLVARFGSHWNHNLELTCSVGGRSRWRGQHGRGDSCAPKWIASMTNAPWNTRRKIFFLHMSSRMLGMSAKWPTSVERPRTIGDESQDRVLCVGWWTARGCRRCSESSTPSAHRVKERLSGMTITLDLIQKGKTVCAKIVTRAPVMERVRVLSRLLMVMPVSKEVRRVIFANGGLGADTTELSARQVHEKSLTGKKFDAWKRLWMVTVCSSRQTCRGREMALRKTTYQAPWGVLDAYHE